MFGHSNGVPLRPNNMAGYRPMVWIFVSLSLPNAALLDIFHKFNAVAT